MCEKTPRATNTLDASQNNLNSEMTLAPDVYSANAEYSPLYTQLDLQNLSSFMTGNSGNATGGAADLFSSYILPSLTSGLNTANTATRTSTVNDVANLAPGAAAATRAMNPGGASLIDQLLSTSSNELGYGTHLTPEEQTQFNQSVRGGAAARGMGFGPSDVFDESMGQSGFGQQLLQQRMNTAGQAAGESQNFYGDPFAKIANVTSTGSQGAMSLLGLGSSSSGGALGSTANEFNPQSKMGQDYANNQFKGQEDVSQEMNHGMTSL